MKRTILATSLLLALSACGGGGGSAPSTTNPPATPPSTTIPPVQTVDLMLSAASTQVQAGAAPVALTATATNGAAVSWQLSAGAPGALSATTGGAVTYIPPATLQANTQVTITATADGVSKSIVLTVTPVSTITLNAPAFLAMAGGAPLALTANSPGSASINWQLAPGMPGALSASTGKQVNYLPPASLATITQVAVTLTADNISKNFTFTVYPDPGAPGLRAVAGALWQAPGMVDGSGAAASFSSLQAIAADGNGGYVVLDRSDAQIALRKVSTTGVVSTLYVGETLPENINSYLPKVAVASDGAVWLLEERLGSNRRLRRVNLAGQGMTVLENLKFSEVAEIQPATDGAVYLISGSAIRRITPEGVISPFAGTLTDGSTYNTPRVDGTGTAAQFNLIWDTASDRAGNLVVNDNGVLRRVTAGAKVTTIATPGLNGNSIHSLAGSADGSAIIYNNDGIFKLGADNTLSTLLQGQAGVRFIGASSDGRVALVLASELRQLSGGKPLPLAGASSETHMPLDGAPGMARFDQPAHIAADPVGNIYVTDTPGVMTPSALGFGPGGMVIRKIAPDGTVSTLMGDKSFDIRSGMVADRAGNLYLSEARSPQGRIEVLGGAIVKVTPAGVISVFAGVRPDGVNNYAPPADGTGTAARFVGPAIIGMDAEENIYVSDKTYYGNQASLRKITPAGVVSTISALPAGLGAASDGYIYQPRGSTIVRIAPDGKETVVADKLKAPSAVTQIGPYTLGVLDSGQVLKLVLPH
ncbi:hypothetical protein [Pseudoduganella sp. OTU4001]|uniref:hypothetical protein n=1 Tax=Pseudoduganella sp. OTU4001 TaxID=3043854 RepID=UPI00313B9D09